MKEREILGVLTELYTYLTRVKYESDSNLNYEIALKALMVLMINGLIKMCREFTEDKDVPSCLNYLGLGDELVSYIVTNCINEDYFLSLIKCLNNMSVDIAENLSDFLVNNYCLIIRKITEYLIKP